MIEIKLGDRYAKSVLDLAVERGELEQVQEDFRLIADVCEANPDFVRMLKSPLVKPDRKQKIVDEIFGGKLSEITKHLLEIIIRKRREPFLRDIALRFLVQYDLLKNITRGTLVSAYPLTAEQRKAIGQLVEKEMDTSFVMEEKTDPELIGGFHLRIGDLLFDGSIAARLRELKQQFEKNPYEKQV